MTVNKVFYFCRRAVQGAKASTAAMLTVLLTTFAGVKLHKSIKSYQFQLITQNV